MAIRKLWDEHEEAILLQALIDVLNHKIERKQAISKVSKQLRNLAVAHGISTDDKFRNENGISLQMNCLEYAYTGGKSGLHVTHGWYFDIVQKYKNDRSSYNELLREANVMSVASTNNKANFKEWLKNTRSVKETSTIISALGMLNLLLKKNSTINNRLTEIDNPCEIADLAEGIKKNQGIRLHSKSCRFAAINALNAYKEFLEHTRSAQEETIKEEQDDTTQTASFTDKKDYAYTRPVSLEYFGRSYSVRNWAALYVQTVKCLYEDYTDEILAVVGKNIGGRGRTDITDADGSAEMLAPKKIVSNLFLETNCSATSIVDKIRQLMDICEVDYSSIEIKYVPKTTVSSGSSVSEIIEEQGSKKSNTDFYIWLTETEGLATPTGRSYSSAINNCDSFCAEHNIGTGRIYGVDSLEEIEHNIELLTDDTEFQDYNDSQHHRFSAALAKYQKFLGLQDEAVEAQPVRQRTLEKKDIRDDELTRIKVTLELPRFEYGFKDDGVELYRFRTFYKEVNGMECALDDDVLLNAIREMGFEFDGKVYLISDDNINAMMNEISEYKDHGINIIYYEQLYDLKLDDYFKAKIVSADMLKALLKHLTPKLRYERNYLALPSEKQTEFELIRNDIIRVWGDNTLQTFDELSLKLPLIPIDKIKSTLAQQTAFVWNSAETYLQADWFEIDEQEIDRLSNYIDKECEEHGGASLDEIPFDYLKAANPEFSDTALITCFCKLVEDRFERNARILTRKGASKDTYTAVIEFCRSQDKCTYKHLENIAKKVAGTIRQPDIIEAANTAMVRIDRDDFIADRLIYFDVDRIDTALDYIVNDDFIGMREITTFSTFPFCGYGWNLFLLESYCRRFSKKYKYDTRRPNSSNSGAIVVKTCNLSYHDIMVHAVARSGMDLNQEEVFDFLIETGYIERRRYGDIDLLINEAAELRERRK